MSAQRRLEVGVGELVAGLEQPLGHDPAALQHQFGLGADRRRSPISSIHRYAGRPNGTRDAAQVAMKVRLSVGCGDDDVHDAVEFRMLAQEVDGAVARRGCGPS